MKTLLTRCKCICIFLQSTTDHLTATLTLCIPTSTHSTPIAPCPIPFANPSKRLQLKQIESIQMMQRRWRCCKCISNSICLCISAYKCICNWWSCICVSALFAACAVYTAWCRHFMRVQIANCELLVAPPRAAQQRNLFRHTRAACYNARRALVACNACVVSSFSMRCT